MTKYTSVPKREIPRKIRQVHPIWRVIGCAFMILIPVVSFALGKWTIDYGLDNDWVIPYQLLRAPQLPGFLFRSTALATILTPITTWDYFYAYAAATFLYMVILGGTLSVVNAFVYQVAGPPRWGPQDVPPPKIKTREYKR